MLNKSALLKDFEDFCLKNEIEKNKSAYLLGLVLKHCNYIPTIPFEGVEYKTMFEYFGKPQGKELNESTFKTAVREGIQVNKKQVTNKNYNGFVMSYPISFLDSLFNVNDFNSSNPNYTGKPKEDDDLPF